MGNAQKAIRIAQRYFLESRLLPCSLRSHRIANPRPKMAKPFLGFAHPPPKYKRTATENKSENDVQFDRLDDFFYNFAI